MPDTTITLTEDERGALGYALDLAYVDQQAYIYNGSPAIDYGDEWPEARAMKVNEFRDIATAAEKMGFYGERDRWERLAVKLQSGK